MLHEACKSGPHFKLIVVFKGKLKPEYFVHKRVLCFMQTLRFDMNPGHSFINAASDRNGRAHKPESNPPECRL